MVEVAIFLLLLASFATFLVVKLLRRGNRPTETADGLRIEQARRDQAHSDRMTYNSLATHGSPYGSFNP
ncbi:hypothetical protein [Streptomyces sp. NPDC026673]|uniref:hypothetical protein n=1 Tax=Streptomyces sp. NPDC026673 TaxID=3155724 RepID=UPI0033D65950